MSRTKLFLTLTGVTLAAGATGCALGLMFAPASGTELRRRLVWKAGEWRSAVNAGAKFVERATGRARGELLHRKEAWMKACA
jgi:hypothetical protein